MANHKISQLGTSSWALFIKHNSSMFFDETLNESACSNWQLMLRTNWREYEMWNDRKWNRNKLCTYRLYKYRPLIDSCVNNVMNREHRQTLARFRCRNLKLEIETGRYSKPERTRTYCHYWNRNCVCDEKHILIICQFYSDIRFELFNMTSFIKCGFLCSIVQNDYGL